MHTYICLYRGFVLVRGSSCPGFCREGFVRVICVRPSLSECIRYNRKLNIPFNFKFHMYEINLKSVTSHALGPLPFHKPSNLLGPPPAFEHDVLYGRPLMLLVTKPST